MKYSPTNARDQGKQSCYKNELNILFHEGFVHVVTRQRDIAKEEIKM